MGYKTPPTASRWKPGYCPNPRGRPKGNLDLEFAVLLQPFDPAEHDGFFQSGLGAVVSATLPRGAASSSSKPC
jgi:hypothetical protein